MKRIIWLRKHLFPVFIIISVLFTQVVFGQKKEVHITPDGASVNEE
jgi:hypothetical protein